jgi:P pilus assembly chaperone PapD
MGAPVLRTLAAALGLMITASFPGYAQVTVDRGAVEFRPAGAPQTTAVRVRNETPEPLQADIKLEDWQRNSYGHNQWLAPGSLSRSCGDRLSAFPEALTLQPGEEADLRITLDHTDGSKSCWGAVLLETSRQVSDGGHTYVLRTAVKVYGLPEVPSPDGLVGDLRILPQSTLQGEMAAALGRAQTSPFSEEANRPSGASDVPMVEVLFENTGNTQVTATGRVEFRRPDGTVETTLDLPDMYVLPNAAQRVSTSLPALPEGQYAVLAIVDYGGDELTAMQMDYYAQAP